MRFGFVPILFLFFPVYSELFALFSEIDLGNALSKSTIILEYSSFDIVKHYKIVSNFFILQWQHKLGTCQDSQDYLWTCQLWLLQSGPSNEFIFSCSLFSACVTNFLFFKNKYWMTLESIYYQITENVSCYCKKLISLVVKYSLFSFPISVFIKMCWKVNLGILNMFAVSLWETSSAPISFREF